MIETKTQFCGACGIETEFEKSETMHVDELGTPICSECLSRCDKNGRRLDG